MAATAPRCGRRAAAAPAGRARASRRTRAVAAGGGVRWNPAQQVSVRWPRRDAFGQSLVPTYLRVVAPYDRPKHTPRGPNSIAVGARPKPFIPRQAANKRRWLSTPLVQRRPEAPSPRRREASLRRVCASDIALALDTLSDPSDGSARTRPGAARASRSCACAHGRTGWPCLGQQSMRRWPRVACALWRRRRQRGLWWAGLVGCAALEGARCWSTAAWLQSATTCWTGQRACHSLCHPRAGYCAAPQPRRLG